MQQRPQDFGDVRAERYIHRRAAYIDWNQPKREIYVIVSKAGRAKPPKPFDESHGAKGFGVCPAEFQSCFDPVFPQYACFPPWWNSNVYFVWKYVVFFFTGVIIKKLPLSLRRDSGLLNRAELARLWGLQQSD